RAHYFAKKDDKKSLDSGAAFWNKQSGNFVLKVGEGEDAVAYSINFNITTEESENPENSVSESIRADNASGNYVESIYNSYKVDENDDYFKTSPNVKGWAAYEKVVSKYGDSFSTKHEMGHSLGSWHTSGLMRGAATSENVTPSSIKAMLKGVDIGNSKMKNKNNDPVGRGHIRKETGNRPNGFSEGSIINKAQYNRQMQRAAKKSK